MTKSGLEAEVNRWRRHRPRAEHRDAPGSVVAWPHRRARYYLRSRARVLRDLRFASAGIEREIVADAEPLKILSGVTAPVARTSHLIAMKLLAADSRTRPQDFDDIRALTAVASAPELRRVNAALRLIERRAFARGRDLIASWRATRAAARRTLDPRERGLATRKAQRRRRR